MSSRFANGNFLTVEPNERLGVFEDNSLKGVLKIFKLPPLEVIILFLSNGVPRLILLVTFSFSKNASRSILLGVPFI